MKRRDAIRRAAFLSGAALTAPMMTTLLQGCKTTGSPTWSSSVLGEAQVQALQTFANLLFPKTETVGASEVNTAEMVDILLTDCSSPLQQSEVSAALTMLNEKAAAQGGKSIFELDTAEQESFLRKIETEVYDGNLPQKEGYIALKSLTMLAYFTSEPVMKNVLNYNPLPGRYDGCITIGKDDAVFVDNNV